MADTAPLKAMADTAVAGSPAGRIGTVLVFGATGGTGKLLISKLAALNPPPAAIRVVVREGSEGKLPKDFAWQEPGTPSDGTRFERVLGTPTDKDTVAAAMNGMDSTSTVVVSLGGPPKGPGVDICSVAQTLINAEAQTLPSKPLMVVVSSIGVGDHYQHCGVFAKFFSSFVIREALEDKDKQEQMVRRDFEDWIIVRPGGLVDEPARNDWRAAHDICGCYPKIAREDVASFIARECVLPGRASQWYKKSPAVLW